MDNRKILFYSNGAMYAKTSMELRGMIKGHKVVFPNNHVKVAGCEGATLGSALIIVNHREIVGRVTKS